MNNHYNDLLVRRSTPSGRQESRNSGCSVKKKRPHVSFSVSAYTPFHRIVCHSLIAICAVNQLRTSFRSWVSSFVEVSSRISAMLSFVPMALVPLSKVLPSLKQGHDTEAF